MNIGTYNKEKKEFKVYKDFGSVSLHTGLTVGQVKRSLLKVYEDDFFIVGRCELVKSRRGGDRKGVTLINKTNQYGTH